ncbi:hypothetical protein Y032_0050g2017 [Ancylostoma ceylanicum]|uniref:Uncharacterized protein n=1 Tax=Ancylostoma ceylanicum TaxID=53326 RepID=A0A016U8L4_9BILA|nr:hypothetical protein Y032_0050g2017 [Ancylostoma ceylanicum]
MGAGVGTSTLLFEAPVYKTEGITVRYTFPPYVSSGARDLINKLLQREPEERLSLTEVMEHEWVQHHLRKREASLRIPKKTVRDVTSM